MAVTIQSILNQVMGHYAEISQTLALTLLNDAHTEILTKVRLVQDTPVTVNTVAATGEYVIADAIYHIFDASIAGAALSQTTIVDLDSDHRGWRSQAAAQPTQYYIDAGYIGFYPIPDAAYAVTLITSQATAALGPGDSLPSPAREGTAWIYRTLYKFALMEHPSDAQLWKENYETAMLDLSNYITYRTPKINLLEEENPALESKK